MLGLPRCGSAEQLSAIGELDTPHAIASAAPYVKSRNDRETAGLPGSTEYDGQAAVSQCQGLPGATDQRLSQTVCT